MPVRSLLFALLLGLWPVGVAAQDTPAAVQVAEAMRPCLNVEPVEIFGMWESNRPEDVVISTERGWFVIDQTTVRAIGGEASTVLVLEIPDPAEPGAPDTAFRELIERCFVQVP